jgi:hypothetical protein
VSHQRRAPLARPLEAYVERLDGEATLSTKVLQAYLEFEHNPSTDCQQDDA